MRLPTRHMAAVVATAALVVTPLAVTATPAIADSTTPSGANFGRLFYDGTTVRTVATPTSMPGRGVDDIYAVVGGAPGQLSVTAVAPGDNYHGGRWAVHVVTWNTAPYLLTSDEAVQAAQSAGSITITRVPAADFVCPVAGR
jgi:hypothetical protein